VLLSLLLAADAAQPPENPAQLPLSSGRSARRDRSHHSVAPPAAAPSSACLGARRPAPAGPLPAAPSRNPGTAATLQPRALIAGTIAYGVMSSCAWADYVNSNRAAYSVYTSTDYLHWTGASIIVP
jgi:hypothetical protein